MKRSFSRSALFPLLIFIGASVGPSPSIFQAYEENIPGTEMSISLQAIPGGTFKMGSSEGKEDEQPVLEVKVDSFWMGTYEITWDQYELFQRRAEDAIKAEGENPEVMLEVDGVAGATPPYTDMTFGMGKDGYPAINVTHYAASIFCKWLSAKTGHFYRLPTEAEWEYAARAGSDTKYHFGNDPSQLDEYAWYKANSEGGYHQVGKKKPNPWGLYDMHGNVAEWTLDQYAEDTYQKYTTEDLENPWRAPEELYPRTARGGSWLDEAEELRSSSRKPSHPDWKIRDPQLPKSLWWLTDAPFVGFRIVRPKKTPSPEEIETYWPEAMEDF